MRARFNGMKYRPSRRGDLYAWDTYSIALIDGCSTVQDETCIAVRRDCACSPARPLLGGGKMGGAHAQNAVCSRSLPCVKLVNVGSTRRCPGRDGDRDRPLKPVLQKRLKKRTDCGGKHLGCSWEANQGLQCGLSGNSVPNMVTSRHGL